jgi:hypothetical protein
VIDVAYLIVVAVLVSALIVGVARYGVVGLMHGLGSGILKAWDRISYGTPDPPQLPVRTFPLVGCDPRVAAVIERGGSDEELIHEAENLAYRLYNGSVPRDQQQRPRDGLGRSQGGPVQSLDGLVHEVLSIPHVTATTPKVTYDLNEKCADCEFETMTMFGGEVAIPVRTYACPKHQEHP